MKACNSMSIYVRFNRFFQIDELSTIHVKSLTKMSKLILSWLLKMVLTNIGHAAPKLPNCSKIVVAPSLARKNIQKPSKLPLRHRFSEWRSCSEWFCLFCFLSGRSQTGSIAMVNYGAEICLNTLRIVISVNLLVWTRYGCSLEIKAFLISIFYEKFLSWQGWGISNNHLQNAAVLTILFIVIRSGTQPWSGFIDNLSDQRRQGLPGRWLGEVTSPDYYPVPWHYFSSLA